MASRVVMARTRILVTGTFKERSEQLMRPRFGRLASAGFTLIEVMVVVLIIGITVSMAMLSIGSGELPVQTEARRLQVLLGLVREESILQGRNLGLRFKADGYQFFALSGEHWLPLEEDSMLRPREMPSDLRLELEAEGEKFEFFPADDDKKEDKDAKQDDAPQVYFLSSGEVSPFNLVLRPFDGDALQLRVGEGGGVEIEILKR